ncbi:MAG: hypothetical protein J5I50_07705 [Chitinophagaceae bacterium]|nr:hypothetical protein [Chitinophagaceae bacterium]
MKKYVLIFASLLLIMSCSKDKDSTGTDFSDQVKTVSNKEQGAYFKVNGKQLPLGERVFLDADWLPGGGLTRQIRISVPDYGSLHIKFAFPRIYLETWREELYKEHKLNPTRFLLEYSFGLNYVHSEAFFNPYGSNFQDKNGTGTVRMFENKKIGSRTIKIYGELDAVFYDLDGEYYEIEGYFWKDADFK